MRRDALTRIKKGIDLNQVVDRIENALTKTHHVCMMHFKENVKNYSLFSATHLLSYAAQRFRRDSKIRCYILLWCTVDQIRIHIHKRQIRLFG